MSRNFHYEIFADYHQFYLQDDDESFGDLSKAWTEEAPQLVCWSLRHASLALARSGMWPSRFQLRCTWRPYVSKSLCPHWPGDVPKAQALVPRLHCPPGSSVEEKIRSRLGEERKGGARMVCV